MKNRPTTPPPAIDQLAVQARRVRRMIITKAARDGGHVASPLGAVEIIQALLYVYDFTKDKITFDVGHQMHAYKILTDRAEAFWDMDLQGGIGEYANVHESRFDFYTGGHAGTALSAALGYAVNHPEYKSITLLGDGSMTGGQPYEALNQAGDLRANLLVVYNDNDFSNTANVGYLHTGKRLRQFSESLGFEYVGVIDGHDTAELIKALRVIKSKRYPVFLHIKTVKGKGYEPAEKDPITFHQLGPFDRATGRLKHRPKPTLRHFIVPKLSRILQSDPRVHVVTPAAARGTGIWQLQRMYPERVFDVGTAEAALRYVCCRVGAEWRQSALFYSGNVFATGIRPDN